MADVVETVIQEPAAVAPKAIDPLPSLPASIAELTGRDVAADHLPPPPLTEAPPALVTGSDTALTSLEERLRHAAASTARDDLWRPVARVLTVVTLFLFSLRILFDDVLPKLVLAVVLGAAGSIVLAMLLHALAQARRQRSLLAALKRLTRTVRADPQLAATLAPQIDAVLSTLREEPAAWSLASLLRAK